VNDGPNFEHNLITRIEELENRLLDAEIRARDYFDMMRSRAKALNKVKVLLEESGFRKSDVPRRFLLEYLKENNIEES
jgi:hypothetical protein